MAVLDDAHDEGEETLTLTLSNASGAVVTDGETTGTIENADLMPAALLARIGRATAEHVVEHIDERRSQRVVDPFVRKQVPWELFAAWCPVVPGGRRFALDASVAID